MRKKPIFDLGRMDGMLWIVSPVWRKEASGHGLIKVTQMLHSLLKFFHLLYLTYIDNLHSYSLRYLKLVLHRSIDNNLVGTLYSEQKMSVDIYRRMKNVINGIRTYDSLN